MCSSIMGQPTPSLLQSTCCLIPVATCCSPTTALQQTAQHTVSLPKRLLKMSHYSSALEDLVSAVHEERRSFAATLYLLAIALFLSSSMMYLAESDVQPDHFKSIPESMWWSLITLTTVGYGDVYPITPIGKFIGALTALMGVCTVALLTGIVASAFSNQMARREAIFEAEINAAMSDGIITSDEKRHIETIRARFNIPEEHAKAILDLLSEKKGPKTP